MSHVDEAVERAARSASPPQAGGRVGVAELTHGIVRGLLSEYVDGSLDLADRERVDRHLDQCASCSAYLTTLRKTVELLSLLPSRPAPPATKAGILSQARDATN